MSKSLVIVESPAKAKTINQYLGDNYEVHSCVGHVRDLPASGGGRTRKKNEGMPEVPPEGEKYAKIIRSMGVNPYKKWVADYQVLPNKTGVIAKLKKLASKAPAIYLATDQDREGEAIAWHLSKLLGEKRQYKRVSFSEITKDAIEKSFSQPEEIDQNKVSAQQARRFLDRVVGYMLSPLLWKKIARGLSAGRVQSVAVRLIVEREKEIRRFVPEEFWELNARVETDKNESFLMEVFKKDGKSFKPKNKEATDAAVDALKNTSPRIVEVIRKKQAQRPLPPFITSTLQQSASSVLGFTVKRTMIAAQKLYEAGHITYMRTDSFNLSADSLKACRAYIKKAFGDKYLPEATRYYKRGNRAAQQAHEAIRPTRPNLMGEKLPGKFGETERKLYDLIRRRFVSCQMSDAQFLTMRVIAEANNYQLKANGRKQEFDGFLKVWQTTKETDSLLPDLREGQELNILELLPQQHWTKPPPRYGEASLVRELEKRSIGRPSTYAPIISTIQERGYVYLHQKRFYAEKIAEIVTDRLKHNFENILDYDFTAKMEEQLDDIAEGEQDWHKLLDNFYTDFIDLLEKADAEDAPGMKKNLPIPTGLPCPKCGRDTVIRNSSQGIFVACTGYEDKENQCRHTINLQSAGGPERVPAGPGEEEETELPEQPPEEHRKCPKCGAPMLGYVVDAKNKLFVCENNPDCDGIETEQGDFSALMPKTETLECERCDGEMKLLSGRFGKYYACDKCDNKRRLLKNGMPAPPVMRPVPTEIPCVKYPDANYILREGQLGLFLAAPGFPKRREARTLWIGELLPYKEQLEDKFHYLTEAPVTDEEGNPTQIRYSRKKRQTYLLSVKDDKDTGWRAYYQNKHWNITKEKPRPIKSRVQMPPPPSV